MGDQTQGVIGGSFLSLPFLSPRVDLTDTVNVAVIPDATYTFTIPVSAVASRLAIKVLDNNVEIVADSYRSDTDDLIMTFVAPANVNVTFQIKGTISYEGTPSEFRSGLFYSIDLTSIEQPTTTNGDDDLFGGDALTALDLLDGDDRWTGVTSAGGADADTFVFADVVNADTITDFKLGSDKIDIASYGAIADADLRAMINDVDGNAVVDLGQFGTVTLDGISATDLTLENFIYLPDESFIVL